MTKNTELLTNKLSRTGAAIIRNLLECKDIGDYHEDIPEEWGEIAQAVSSCPSNPDQRYLAFEAAIAGHQEGNRIRELVSAAKAEDLTRLFRIDGLLSADDILNTDWPEPVWAIPNMLPVGLTILAGRSKIGKSWLALQVAQSVAAGGIALGEQVEDGPILYLALEDPPRRLNKRMKKQKWPAGLDADFLTIGNFYDHVGNLQNGGAERLSREIEQQKYRLVVLDTFSRAIGGDQQDVFDMTTWLTPLQEMAHEKNCAVVMVDHHRKSSGFNPDAVADILGSTAKGAMADTVWGLYRERGKSGAKLMITGREIEEKTLALEFHVPTGCWQNEGDVNMVTVGEVQAIVLEAVRELGKAGVLDIAKAAGQEKGNAHRRLQELINKGKVIKQKEGLNVFYSVNPEGGV